MALELTKGQKNDRQKVINKYEGAKKKLEALALDLRDLYAIKDLKNREYKLRVLKEKYGGELDVYHAEQTGILNESKKILTSKYVVLNPSGALFQKKALLYTNDSDATATGRRFETTTSGGLAVEVEVPTSLNTNYWPELDLHSEENIKLRDRKKVTLEEAIEERNREEYTEFFNYGTASDTDAWGRDYDHPDYGIDPSSINRTIVTPTPVSDNNNNDEVIEKKDDEVIEKSSNDNSNTSALNLNSSVNTNLGAKDGDLIAVNTNDNKKETPNRLELMTKEIAENPSRIQKGLMGIEKAGDTPTTGWTPERLAGLKIKHQDWKAERRNRKNLQVEAKKA